MQHWDTGNIAFMLVSTSLVIARLVLTLLDLEERSAAEVSQLTGWGHSAVKVRAFRARQKLRKHALQLRMKL